MFVTRRGIEHVNEHGLGELGYVLRKSRRVARKLAERVAAQYIVDAVWRLFAGAPGDGEGCGGRTRLA